MTNFRSFTLPTSYSNVSWHCFVSYSSIYGGNFCKALITNIFAVSWYPVSTRYLSCLCSYNVRVHACVCEWKVCWKHRSVVKTFLLSATRSYCISRVSISVWYIPFTFSNIRRNSRVIQLGIFHKLATMYRLSIRSTRSYAVTYT